MGTKVFSPFFCRRCGARCDRDNRTPRSFFSFGPPCQQQSQQLSRGQLSPLPVSTCLRPMSSSRAPQAPADRGGWGGGGEGGNGGAQWGGGEGAAADLPVRPSSAQVTTNPSRRCRPDSRFNEPAPSAPPAPEGKRGGEGGGGVGGGGVARRGFRLSQRGDGGRGKGLNTPSRVCQPDPWTFVFVCFTSGTSL